jgi:cytidylate kinase
MPKERLQRILAQAGMGSRRTCERLIAQGHVTVDDQLVTELGATADPLVSTIRVDGVAVHREPARYIVLHKPAGYLSNADARSGYPSWQRLVPAPERLFAVGRLDLDSEGLLLLTNDGELAQHLSHPRYEHPKTYLVLVSGLPDPRKLRRLQHGIMLDDGPTAPAEVTLLRNLPPGLRFLEASREKRTSWLEVTLREGRKRQLRRMVARVGHPALRVIRIALGPLSLGSLPPGKWRELWPAEVEALRSALHLDEPSTAKTPSEHAAGRRQERGRRKPTSQVTGREHIGDRRMPSIVALDGPSASGKSTVGRILADRLGYLYFDTGAMYRAVAFLALKRGISLSDEAAISALARECDLRILPATEPDGRDTTVIADGTDITWDIRSPDVERAVSPVSALAGVREVLRLAQRRVGLGGRVVMVGRDIGTAVLPEADLKIYLDASLVVRARRRYLQRQAKGETPDLDDVLTDMKTRDEIDSSRVHSPLSAASDAVVIDTTALTIDEVVARALDLIRRQTGSQK